MDVANTVPQSDAPLIVSIKRLSTEDGPGLRDVVFFKGCPLRCCFCHNPECQGRDAELAYQHSLCIQCERCTTACPTQAILRLRRGIDSVESCAHCDQCVQHCPTSALRKLGHLMSAEELVQQLLRDEPFFRHSNGGVTLSGGECTMTPTFVSHVVKTLKETGIHVALETCGHFDFISFETKILPFLDWIYFDLKLAAPTEHLIHLGVDNELILQNFETLCRLCPEKVHPRIPIVPGVSDSRENLEQLAQLIARHHPCPPTLLPYHTLGQVMYAALGRPLPDGPTRGVTAEEMHRARTYFESAFTVALEQRSALSATSRSR